MTVHTALRRSDPSPRAIRVAFVLHVMHVAGAEVLVAESIRRLAGRIDPVIFCLDAIGPLGEELRASGVPVVSFDRRPGRDWRVPVRMARELRDREIEVIHAHQYTPFFYAALARVLARGRPRLIFTEHGRHYPDVVGRKRRLLNRWLLARLATETNAVCRFSADALQGLDGFSAVRVDVIENGIDPDLYSRPGDQAATRLRAGLRGDRRYVANVARLHAVKDQATLVEAFSLIAPKFDDVDLLLVGDGPMKRELVAHVDRLRLSSRVHFLGVRSDVPSILTACDVFCLSSVSEAASLTLLEAMAAGLPVVVCAVGGNPEIVREGIDGLMIPRRNPQALADALGTILSDSALAQRLGQAGASRAREVYRLDRTIERYYDLYCRMVAAH